MIGENVERIMNDDDIEVIQVKKYAAPYRPGIVETDVVSRESCKCCNVIKYRIGMAGTIVTEQKYRESILIRSLFAKNLWPT